MDKSRQRTVTLTLIGLVLASLLGVAIWVSYKVISQPGPRQIREAELRARAKARGFDIEPLEKRKKLNKKRRKELASLPEFKPPDNEIIPADRMRLYAQVHQYKVKVILEEQENMPKGRKSLQQGLFLAQRIILFVKGAQYDKMVELGVSEAEFEWIAKGMNDAKLLALLKLREITDDPETLELLDKQMYYVAVSGGYSKPDEKGEHVIDLEKFDPSIVPKEHYRYVLQYYKELSYPDVQLDMHDWTHLLEEEGMTPRQHAP